MRTFIFTCGDINGVGPEIVMKTINRINDDGNRYIVVIPENVFTSIRSLITPQFEYDLIRGTKLRWRNPVQILLMKKVTLLQSSPTKESGEASYKAIKTSFRFLKSREADAVITSPVSKYALKMAGVKYPGHTEMFADWSGVKDYVMMFFSDEMKAALNSIHIPAKDIVKYVTVKNVISKLDTVIRTLKDDLGIHHPRVAVLGLNPHAGEEGIIGKEEKKILKPLIADKKELSGPFSPDAFFAKKMYRNYDVVFGMYHDQVLIPFKLLNFNTGVNYTAGLPFVRTSPDHGTAFDIAWRGIADESSMLEAYRYADLIAKNRNTKW
jgi:4-hydroxythreonine-4-phosphate dehydrogenase